MRQALRAGAACAAVVVAVGCGGGEDRSAPRLYPGQTECASCRMLVSDVRFAAALVHERNGEVRKLVFDDFGCLSAHLAGIDATGTSRPFVRDFIRDEWLDARTAIYVHARSIESPMASHLAAVGDRDAANELASRHGGALLTFEDAVRRRRVLPPRPRPR